MTSKTAKIIVPIALAAILGAGIGIGIALDRLWLRPAATKSEVKKSGAQRRRGGDPAKRAERLLTRFEKRLALKGDQVEVVRRALEQMFTDLRSERQWSRKAKKTIRERARAAIRKTLSPAQQQTYQKMIERYETRRVKRRGRGRR